MQAPRLRAITTRYKGFAFRSRQEARWAVFFDHLKVRWDYEPEGFDLGNGLRYLPDFWLPDWGIWLEIKPPGDLDYVTLEKAFRLAQLSGNPVYISNGMPDGVGRLLHHSEAGVEIIDARAAWAGCSPEFDGPGLYFATYGHKVPAGDYVPHGHGDTVTILSDGVPEDYPAPWCADKFYEALEAARSARFEFNAKGGI